MTGPEHYREAERLLDRAHHYTYGDGGDPITGTAFATEAAAHATLALAAATALADAGAYDGMPIEDYNAWRNAASAVADDKVGENQ
ncbi:hypothetical protein SAMN05216251_108249 [Actinacidiphila alni]|uniref:Uncharacterized protein n=1 Tax=Actinacidiphila alni TaxID=380248 RepID=A0A1I2G345_9ACTN|nr:hypothetical protein [Actinacidiphila alni]SFF12084.1 hypothetical protein SAMN05216251_108249 [Actinacidiphila alni]